MSNTDNAPMMPKAPTFLQRRRDPQPQMPPRTVRPDTEKFIDNVFWLEDRVKELEAHLHHQDIEIDKWRGRAGYVELELKRCMIQRDEAQAGYCEIKAQLAMIASTTVAALKAQRDNTATNMQAVIEVIEAALRGAKEKMDRAGIRERVETQIPGDVTEALDDGIKRIAETFGAGRPAAEPEPPHGN